MPLNTSGPISLGGSTTGQSVNLELGVAATAQISFNDATVRKLTATTAGTALVMPTNFYGRSRIDIPTTGLATYLDSTNTTSYPGTGNTWFDLSDNGRNFSWNTASFTAGSPSYFDTLGRRCTGPASNSFGINNTSGYTIFLIALQNSAQQSSAFKFYKNNAGSSSGRGIFTHCTWSDGNIYFDQGGCCGADTRTNVGAGTTNTWNIYTFRRLTNSSTRTILKNGTTLVTNANAATTIDLDSRAVDLGSSDEYGSGSSTWNARLGGFIVYNRGLDDSEITSVYNTIKTRYGIA
jgi:hypothetical protein